MLINTKFKFVDQIWARHMNEKRKIQPGIFSISNRNTRKKEIEMLRASKKCKYVFFNIFFIQLMNWKFAGLEFYLFIYFNQNVDF